MGKDFDNRLASYSHETHSARQGEKRKDGNEVVESVPIFNSEGDNSDELTTRMMKNWKITKVGRSTVYEMKSGKGGEGRPASERPEKRQTSKKNLKSYRSS